MQKRASQRSALFREALDRSLDAVALFKSVRDEQGHIIDFVWIYVNQPAAIAIGHPRDAIIGQRLLTVLPGSRDEVFERYVQVVEADVSHDVEMLYDADGITGWFRTMIVKLDDGVAVFFRNITDERRTLQELSESEERRRIALETGRLGEWFLDLDSGAITVSPQWKANLGLAADATILSSEIIALIHPEDREGVRARFHQAIAEGRDYEDEYRVIWPDGSLHWINACGRFLPGFHTGAHRIVGVNLDVTERRWNEEAQRLLAQASHLLSDSLDCTSTLKRVVRMPIPIFADACILYLIDEVGRVMRAAHAHRTPAGEETIAELERRYPIALQGPTEVARVLRGEVAAVSMDFTRDAMASVAENTTHRELWEAMGVRHFIVLPLRTQECIIGALALSSGVQGRSYGEREAALLAELARRVALAIDNARRYAAEQAARTAAERAVARTDLLQRVSTALNEALTPTQVAERILAEILPPLHALSGWIVALDDDHRYLKVVAAAGHDAALVQRWRRIPLTARTPLADAMRQGKPVWVESLEQRVGWYPEAAASDSGPGGMWAALPLIIEGRTIGGIGLTFAAFGPLPADDHTFVLTLAQQCAQALERARLYEAELAARARVEAAQQQVRFLSGLSVALAESLDYTTTAQQVALLVVPALADWCVVDIVAANGTLEGIAAAHRDAEQGQIVRTMARRYPPDSQSGHPVAQVIRTGEPLVLPTVPQSLLAAIAQSSEHRELLAILEPASALVVPLRARGRTLGAISFVRVGGQPYSEANLPLVQEVARRAAVAIDNARLYAEAQQAVRARDELLSMVSHDLKNPLASILGSAQQGRRRLAREGALAADRAELLFDRIERAGAQMLSQMDELLFFARLASGEGSAVRRQRIDLLLLVRQVVEMHQPQAAQTISVQTNLATLPLVADETQMVRVVENLLTNAIKYSPADSTITVEVSEEQSGPHMRAVVRIIDQGVGIPAADLPHIFAPFRRGRNAPGSTSGSGIGLASARRIVELHGGTIQVTSQEGVGSTFTVRLPVGGG